MTQDTTVAGTTQGSAGSAQDGNGLAIAGLPCGLVGLLFFPIVLGPLAIIFGGIGWSKANHGARHKGLAIASVVLGIADLVVWGVLIAVAAKHGGHFSFHVG